MKVKIMKWEDLKEYALSIYENNKLLSPYQSYRFLSVTGVGKVDKNPLACIGYKPYNFVLFRGDLVVAIAPLYAKKQNGMYFSVPRGYFTSAGHLDFIYREDFSFDEYNFLINAIKQYFGKCEIKMDRVSERSLTFKYASRDKLVKLESSIMVSIDIPENYDAWYKSLSKSVRQNIRTAYNRMNTDGKVFEFKYFLYQSPDKKINSDILHLFARRLCEHSKIKSTLAEALLYRMKSHHPMTVGIDSDPGYIGAVLYIDNKLAAFFNGFVGNDKRVLVPRLAVNLDFNRYSPGGILINEFIKTIKSDEFSEEILELDLQRGDEPYKYSYGGKEYFNYSWSYYA